MTFLACCLKLSTAYAREAVVQYIHTSLNVVITCQCCCCTLEIWLATYVPLTYMLIFSLQFQMLLELAWECQSHAWWSLWSSPSSSVLSSLLLLPAGAHARLLQLYHLLLHPVLLSQEAPNSTVPSKVPTQLPGLISSSLHHLPMRCLPTLPSLSKATLSKVTLPSLKVTLPTLPSLRMHICNHAGSW